MGCINSTKLPFGSIINVPKGFYYNDDHQLSFAVSTDDLNLYVVEETFLTDDVKNPCTDETINDLKVTVREVRMSGTVFYRVALNALISSYNFLLGSQANVNDDGWSSADGSILIESMENLKIVEYVVVGYLDPEDIVVPTSDDVTVVIEKFQVDEYDISEGKVLDVKGEISFIVNM